MCVAELAIDGSVMDRRSFLISSSIVATGAIVPTWHRRGVLHGAIPQGASLVPGGPLLAPESERARIDAALDAARKAGATYADVQLRVVHTELWALPIYPPVWILSAGLSVRAYMHGCWGIASVSGVGDLADAARLGTSAAERARILGGQHGVRRPTALAPLVHAAVGEWEMPIEIDPFAVSNQEKFAVYSDLVNSVSMLRNVGDVEISAQFRKERRVFGSTDGGRTTQTVYTTGVDASISTRADWSTERSGSRTVPFLTKAGVGWEYVRNAPLRERAEAMVELALRARRPKPATIGRYDIVFDAQAAANVLDASIGRATELDRALGYRANDEGTSYLSDPLAMLDTYRVAADPVTITTNRSLSGGGATVKWDDEGVAPVDATLVKNGILHDFQTTRESAQWLAPVAERRGRAAQSNGCAGAYAATEPVRQVSPNLTLVPGPTELSLETMIRQVKRGLVVYGGGISTSDYQALTGAVIGDLVFEIVDGTVGECIAGAEINYRSPELWKAVTAIGGPGSAGTFGLSIERPDAVDAAAVHTVSAVPMVVAGLVVTNRMGA
jgi:TldD protein